MSWGDNHSSSLPWREPVEALAKSGGEGGRRPGEVAIIIALFLILFWHQSAIAPGNVPVTNLPLAETLPETILLAVGDILLSRHVGTKIDQAGNVNLPFEKVAELLRSADITFGNLECPLSDSNIPIREGLIFRCLTKYVPGLLSAGFDVLSTANNHSFDQGADNLDFTIDYLRSQNILPVGTSKCHCEECNDEAIPASNQKDCFANTRNDNIVERHNIKFGFLAYSYSAFNDGKLSTHPQIATMDVKQVKKDIANLKFQADIIIVSMHAGLEYTRHPNQTQIDFAHAAIDAGADVVIGHHPHWIQNVEVYSPPTPSPGDGRQEPVSLLPSPDEGRVPAGQERFWREVENKHRGIIFYSLGNFVFDQMWSQETREGLAVRLNFKGRELKSAELIPVIVDDYCCPRLATEVEKIKKLEKINLKANVINFNP